MFELSQYSEYQSIDNDEESLMPSPKKQPPRLSLNALASTSLVLAVLGTIVLFKATTLPSWNGVVSLFKVGGGISSHVGTNTINFAFKRVGYEAIPYFDLNNKDITKYEFLGKYIGLIEPYADMGFHMYDASTHDVHYSVCNDAGVCQKGVWTAKDDSSDSIKFECEAYDTLSVTVRQFNDKKQEMKTVKGQAVCIYVRRETRKMTEEDMNKFITASRVMNDVSDAQGQDKYGSKYLSSSTLVKYHHFNAMQQDGDHIHEGNGFMIQHVKLANMFEAAVQAVDPSVSLPYWDFTIDSAQGLTANMASIFRDKMYGTNNQPKDASGWTYKEDRIESGRIADGPWKDLKIEKNPYPGEPYDFGYGYMRAPWNMNPSPYVSRYPHTETESKVGHSYMPTCSNHYDILQFDDRMDFYYQISYEPHGQLHILEGGFYGCDLLQPLVDQGYITDYNAVCYFWVFTLKELYRAGSIVPNKGCKVADDIQDSKCGYTCPNEGAEVWNTVHAMLQAGLDTSKEGIEDAFKSFVCGGDGGRIFPGDHLESASPADPSFWVIHPTLERLLHAKMFAGGFEGADEWPSNARKEYVCNKASCYESVTGRRSSSVDCCYGHYQDDKLYDGLSGTTTTYVGPTNRETESATNVVAMDYSMPYIYDSFDWSHCEEDFDGLLEDMHQDLTESMTILMGKEDKKQKKVPRPALQETVRMKKQLAVEKLTVMDMRL